MSNRDTPDADESELVSNPAAPVDGAGLIRPADLADDRQIISDGSGDGVPGLSKTTISP